MKVREAMAKTIATASPDEEIVEVARKMKEEDAGFIPVTQGEKLVGVITDRDIVIRCVAEGHDCLHEKAEHVMSTDVTTISPEDDLKEAAAKMETEMVRRLPVVEGGHLVGVLSHGNLVQATRSEGPAKQATLGVTQGA